MTLEREKIIGQRRKFTYPNMITYYREPIHLVSARGSYVWDEQGNRYLDAVGGIVSICVGHNHPKIKEKMQQMSLKSHFLSF